MHNPRFDVVPIKRPSSLVVNHVIDKWNMERVLVSCPCVRFCPRVLSVRVFNLPFHIL